MNKIELLAPAKDLEKAKIAVLYGADAVYVGGKYFSLRSRASNFDLDDFKTLVEFAHERNVRVYVTVNIVFHDKDFYGVKEYLEALQELGVDAIIVSSIYLLKLAKSVAPKLECHMSTQLSITNSLAINQFKEVGADRIVLARELSMKEIEDVTTNSSLPIEAFIHGGMCSNYSGRCTLSNRMTLRDANRGGCAHSCRWKYMLYDEHYTLSQDDCMFTLSSKDLRASAYIEDMIHAGVSSLKIEGRMKSEYYIAQVVKTYRKMIDEIYEKGHLDEERLAYYDYELSKAENRPSDDGFLSGDCDNTKHLYGINGAGVTHDYVAIVKNYDPNRNLALVEVKNKFEIGDELEVFGPKLENSGFTNELMFNEDWKMIESANQPTELLYLRLPYVVEKNDMIRRIHRNAN